MNGVVTLKRSGPVLSGSDEEWARLRAHFEERHHLSLPGFLDPLLLDMLRERLAATEFIRIDRDAGSESRPLDNTPYTALELLLNSRALLDLIPRLTPAAPAPPASPGASTGARPARATSAAGTPTSTGRDA